MDAVGLGEGTPLYGTNNLTMHYNGGLVSFQQFKGDDAYFDILGIREKQDNHTAEASWWLNEYAFREMGIDESAPEAVFEGGNRFPIGGIYYDFKIRPLLYAQSSAMISTTTPGHGRNSPGQSWSRSTETPPKPTRR